jgi:hypothetical protein
MALLSMVVGWIWVGTFAPARGGEMPSTTVLPVATQGVLAFIPPPDLTICYCGSYFLTAEKGYIDYYLYAPEIDLSKHIGKRIVVTGTPYTTVCTGTLYRVCKFLRVTGIDEFAPTPTEETTWGRVKGLFE